jgi:hypothetical protein
VAFAKNGHGMARREGRSLFADAHGGVLEIKFEVWKNFLIFFVRYTKKIH